MLKRAVTNMLGNPGKPTHGYLVQPMAKFQSLDVEAIRNELGLDETATIRGRQNLPQSDATAPDDTERAVIKKVELYRKQAKDLYDSEIQAYGERLKTLDLNFRALEMADAARKAESDFKTTIQHAVSELTQLREERDRAAADLHAFRELHRLSREPNLPSMPGYVSWAIILAVLAAETFLNGLFFGERVEGGMVQGFVEAFGFAFINVVVGCFLAAFAGRNLIHVSGQRRSLGVGILIMLLTALAFSNLLAGHYRGVLMADMEIETATTLALERLIANPLGIGDGKSWLLVGLGFIAATMAAIKVWKNDDPYPGYGDKYRAHMNTVDAFIAAKRARMDEITERRDEAHSGMMTSLKALDASLAGYRGILDNRRRFHESFVSYLDDLEGAANDLLTAYRQKNREARSAQAPEYFATPYVLARPQLEEPPSQERELAEMASLAREVGERLRQQQDALHDSNDQAIERLGTIG